MPEESADIGRDVRARSAPLHARDVGNGTPVLLLHAFPLNGRMWEPQLGALRARVRLVVPDLPGFGLSPPSSGSPTLTDYAGAVLGVLDALAIDRVVVVGLSLGGYVAFALVELLGARLAGLLLADTRANPDTEDAARRRHELAAEIEASGVDVAAAEFIPKLIGPSSQRARPDLIDRVRAMIRENTPAGLAAALRAMAARADATPRLPRIHCPTLCVVGEEDTLTPPAVAEAMAERIPGGRVRRIPLAGHLTSLEAPDAFNDALEELVAECTPA